METMSHVWKCNLKKLVIPQNQSFHNLTTIILEECKSIKYLFSPLVVKLLTNLKKVAILDCDGIEEVVSNRYDDNDEVITSISAQTNTMFCHHLESLELYNLPRLKSTDGGNARDRSSEISSNSTITTTFIHDQFTCSQVGVAFWSKIIKICSCHELSRAIPSYVAGQLCNLEELSISECNSMIEVFETEGVNNSGVHSTNVGDDTCTTMTIPRSENMTLLELPNLSILKITYCKRLEHIFTSSMLESLKQLKHLTVEGCKAMKVIVKEDGESTKTSKTLVFPRLKSFILADLPNVKGFFLGMNEFRWPLLERVKIYGRPHMMNLTSGHSIAPKLNYIDTGLGKHSLECGLNFHMTNATHEIMCSSPDMIKLLQFPWSFSSLVEAANQELLKRHIVFPCNGLLNLKNLEKIRITKDCHASTIEVFEVVERTNDDVNEIQSVVVFQKLKELTLEEQRKTDAYLEVQSVDSIELSKPYKGDNSFLPTSWTRFHFLYGW